MPLDAATDDLHQLRVLIVEDDKVDVQAFMRAMRQSEHRRVSVSIAHEGETALRLLRSQRITWPYVVILDLDLPGMDGLEFLRALRSDPSIAGTPVYVWSKSRNQREIDAAYYHGVWGYFRKDARPDATKDLLKAVFGMIATMSFPSGPGLGPRRL